MSSTRAKFLAEIERFIDKHQMDTSAFGKLARNDPAFVLRLRRGRVPHVDTMDEVREFMANFKQACPKSRPLSGAAA